MSGAFNIDVEVGKSGGNQIKIYCASLTETWTVDHTDDDLMRFHGQLSVDPAIKKNKIALSHRPSVANIAECEEFLSGLACTSAVLRVALFHDFLNIPQSVRDGLTYASHKPFGKTLREGYMQRHPRFVRRGGGRKWIRLTREERGGSLIAYKDENKGSPLASIKIGASTQIQNLKEKGIQNAFVIKSGKRQWVLQASNPRDYQAWSTHLENILKQFGGQIGGGGSTKEEEKDSGAAEDIQIGIGAAGNTGQADKYRNQNMKLKQELDALHGQMEGMQRELDRLKLLYEEAGSGKEAMTRKVEMEFAKEKDSLIRDYELQHQNLENELQDLHRQCDAKTAMDSGGGGAAKFLAGFTAGLQEDLQCEIDAEKKSLDKLTEDERSVIKFMHKHLHRHVHKHTHSHKHIHLHKDAADNVDIGDDIDIERVNKHTIAHTITHTNTQFQINKFGFF